MTTLELPFPDIDPVAINLFGLKIHWYAIMYLVAFALGYVLMRRRLRKEPYSSITKPKPWAPSDVEDLLLDEAVTRQPLGEAGQGGDLLAQRWSPWR